MTAAAAVLRPPRLTRGLRDTAVLCTSDELLPRLDG